MMLNRVYSCHGVQHNSGSMLLVKYSCVADINECLPNGGRGPCAQNCTNTIGSFQCSCNAGYTLSGYACNGEGKQLVFL